MPPSTAHIHVLARHAVAVEGIQGTLQQQLGHQVVEAAHHHAKLHARANQPAHVSVTSGGRHAHRRAGGSAAPPLLLLPGRRGSCGGGLQTGDLVMQMPSAAGGPRKWPGEVS